MGLRPMPHPRKLFAKSFLEDLSKIFAILAKKESLI